MIEDFSMNDDLRLVEEIRFGNQKSLKDLSNKYSNIIRLYLRSYGLSLKETDSLVKEIFDRTFGAVHAYDESKTIFLSWFGCFIRFTLFNRHLINQNHIEKRVFIFDVLKEMSKFLIKGTDFTVKDVIIPLNNQEAEVIGYRLVYKLSYEEISELIGINEKEVSKIEEEGLKKLRDENLDIE